MEKKQIQHKFEFIRNLWCGFNFKSPIYVFASTLGFSHAKVFKFFAHLLQAQPRDPN